MKAPLLCLDEKGLYCPAGGFYIDPMKSVDCAVTTHAHSDHARRGSREYICATTSVGLMRARLGASIHVRGIPFGEVFQLGAAQVSFHPAGHILGSAQVRIEVQGEVWVVSGDYKREPDPSCEPFESVPCDVFVTEATFGTPAYRWKRQQTIGAEIAKWWQENRAAQRNSVVLGYSLGKSQRILAELLPYVGDETVWIHPTLEEITERYREAGIALPRTQVLTPRLIDAHTVRGGLIVAPPQIRDSDWTVGLRPHEMAFASGWMADGGRNPNAAKETGFVVSDHADWPDLVRTVLETGAKRVYVLHRGAGALVRHLRSLGLQADPIETLRLKPEEPNPQLRFFF